MKRRICTILGPVERSIESLNRVVWLHFFDVDVATTCGLRPNKGWAEWAQDLHFQNWFQESLARRKCSCIEPRIFSPLTRAPSEHTRSVPFKGFVIAQMVSLFLALWHNLSSTLSNHHRVHDQLQVCVLLMTLDGSESGWWVNAGVHACKWLFVMRPFCRRENAEKEGEFLGGKSILGGKMVHQQMQLSCVCFIPSYANDNSVLGFTNVILQI